MTQLTYASSAPASAPAENSAWSWARPRSLLWLLCAVVILRTSGILAGVVGNDETDFLLIGRMLRDGGIPYVDLVEKKPPLIYLFYSPAALFGFTMLPMQIMCILWVFASGLVVGSAAQALTGRREAGWIGAWLLVLITSCNEPAVLTEILLDLPAAGALLFWVRAEQERGRDGRRLFRYDLLTGLCIGAATLFKHQAAILLVAFALALLWQWARAGRGLQLRRHLTLLGGFVLPILLTVAVYAALGHLHELYEWTVERNLFYAGKSVTQGRFLRLGEGLLYNIVLGAPLFWYLALRQSLRRLDPTQVGLVLALWLTWLPVSMGGRFYSHYFIQFAPQLALLATPPALLLLDRWGTLRRFTRVALLLLATAPAAGYLVLGFVRLGSDSMNGMAYPAADRRVIELGTWLRQHTAEHDRIFIWGHWTPIYYLAQRMPATRDYNTSVHMGDFDPGHMPAGFDFTPYVSRRDIDNTLRELEARRPPVFVDTAPSGIHDWSKIPLSKFPALWDYVRAHYAPVATAGGALIYRRVGVVSASSPAPPSPQTP